MYELTKKQEYLLMGMMDSTGGFGNGHSQYMISGLKEDEVGLALEKIKEVEEKYDLIFCDMDIENSVVKGEYTIHTECHEKYQSMAINEISSAFPGANCYWIDCWDDEVDFSLFINGKIHTKQADCCNVSIDYAEKDSDEGTYEIEATVTDKRSGSSFSIGGGCLDDEQYDHIWDVYMSA